MKLLDGENDHWNMRGMVDRANRQLQESRELLLRLTDRKSSARPAREASSLTYHVSQDPLRLWHWTLVAKNGRTLACCGERYFSRQDCLEAIAHVADSGDASVCFRDDGGRSVRI